MKLTVKGALPDPRRFVKDGILKAYFAASKAMAERIPEVMIDRIERGVAPDLTAQKPNAPGWGRKKGGKPPLVYKGVLTRSADDWVVSAKGGGLYDIMVPRSRQDEVNLLETWGFKVYVFDNETMEEIFEEEFERELALLDFDKFMRPL